MDPVSTTDPTNTPSNSPSDSPGMPSTVAPSSEPPGSGTTPEPTAEPTPEPTMPPGDTPPVRSTTGPSYAATVEPIFSMKCTETCHEPGGTLGGPGGLHMVEMDLTTGAGYATLTSGKSVQATSMWIVDETVDTSYLWHKLNDTFLQFEGGTGAKMPITGDLTADELAIVQAWIEGGAAP